MPFSALLVILGVHKKKYECAHCTCTRTRWTSNGKRNEKEHLRNLPCPHLGQMFGHILNFTKSRSTISDKKELDKDLCNSLYLFKTTFISY